MHAVLSIRQDAEVLDGVLLERERIITDTAPAALGFLAISFRDPYAVQVFPGFTEQVADAVDAPLAGSRRQQLLHGCLADVWVTPIPRHPYVPVPRILCFRFSCTCRRISPAISSSSARANLFGCGASRTA